MYTILEIGLQAGPTTMVDYETLLCMVDMITVTSIDLRFNTANTNEYEPYKKQQLTLLVHQLFCFFTNFVEIRML